MQKCIPFLFLKTFFLRVDYGLPNIYNGFRDPPLILNKEV